MNRRSMLIPLAALAAAVGANPASAADGNGWSCISPFASYTNQNYPDDPPAANDIVDSLAITLARADASPLTAVPGQPLALRDLQLQLTFTDPRVAVQMYKRTGGATASYSGIPRGQDEDTVRSFSQRANPGDNNVLYWSYNTGTSQAPVYVYANKVSAGLPQMRLADQPKDTPDYFTAAPALNLAHRYLSHVGNSQFPLDAWVTIAGSNTTQGVQTVRVRGYWQINIQDSTPGTPSNPALYTDNEPTAAIEPVILDLPRTTWTPTGAGAVDFTVAAPGSMGIIQVESKGYGYPGYNKPLNVRPYGSVYVRAQTEAYGASNDCIPGQVTVVNTQISRGQPNLLFGDVDPAGGDAAVGDPDMPGFYLGGSAGTQQKAVGSRGRFGLTFAPLPAIASAALPIAPVPVPAPAPKPVTLASTSTLKPTSAGSVTLKLTNPNAEDAEYTLSAKTVNKYKVGRTKKVVTVAAGKKITLKPGASSVKFSLSKTAKTLLKSRKTLKVKLTLTPVAGGTAVTKTITLKRG